MSETKLETEIADGSLGIGAERRAFDQMRLVFRQMLDAGSEMAMTLEAIELLIDEGRFASACLKAREAWKKAKIALMSIVPPDFSLAAPVPAAQKPEAAGQEKTTVEKLTRNVNQRTWRDWLAVCRTHGVLPHPYGLIIAGLEAEIGSPPSGSHPDEAKPRGETWHAERANWQAEVERLRAAARKEGK
jgi:hypothetical protein